MPGLGQTAGVAPGIFGLAGVFTNPQFQVVIRALNQKKGIDLLSAPRVTTKSGQRAIVEVIREFRYPTTFTAPQVPRSMPDQVEAAPLQCRRHADDASDFGNAKYWRDLGSRADSRR